MPQLRPGAALAVSYLKTETKPPTRQFERCSPPPPGPVGGWRPWQTFYGASRMAWRALSYAGIMCKHYTHKHTHTPPRARARPPIHARARARARARAHTHTHAYQAGSGSAGAAARRRCQSDGRLPLRAGRMRALHRSVSTPTRRPTRRRAAAAAAKSPPERRPLPRVQSRRAGGGRVRDTGWTTGVAGRTDFAGNRATGYPSARPPGRCRAGASRFLPLPPSHPPARVSESPP